MKFIEKEVLRVKFRYSPIVLPKSRVMRYTFSNYQYTFSLTIYRTLFPSSLKNDTRFLRVYTFSKVKTVPTDWRLIRGSGAAARTCEGVNLCNGEVALRVMGTQYEVNLGEYWAHGRHGKQCYPCFGRIIPGQPS